MTADHDLQGSIRQHDRCARVDDALAELDKIRAADGVAGDDNLQVTGRRHACGKYNRDLIPDERDTDRTRDNAKGSRGATERRFGGSDDGDRRCAGREGHLSLRGCHLERVRARVDPRRQRHAGAEVHTDGYAPGIAPEHPRGIDQAHARLNLEFGLGKRLHGDLGRRAPHEHERERKAGRSDSHFRSSLDAHAAPSQARDRERAEGASTELTAPSRSRRSATVYTPARRAGRASARATPASCHGRGLPGEPSTTGPSKGT